MPLAHQALVPDQPEHRPALPLRSDTMLGVCEGLGEEFGFNPNILRLAFAGSFYWNPLAAVGAYLAIGLALALARCLYPATRPASSEAEQPQAPAAANEAAPESLAA